MSEGSKIIELHIDTCAQLKSKTAAAAVALKKLYDATGIAELRYVETQQGLREKTDRTDGYLLDTIKNDLSRHGKFLQDNREWVDVVSTSHCDKFMQMMHDSILPATTWKVMDSLEKIVPDIQRNAYKSLKREGRDVPASPELLTFPFSHFVDSAGRKRGQRIDDRLLRNAVSPHVRAWKDEVKTNPVLKGMRTAGHKGTLIGLMRATQEARAIAFELALRIEPDVMKEYGYTQSPIGLDVHAPVDIARVKEQAHRYPPLSLRQPPFTELYHQEIIVQALRMTDLWPWQFKANATHEEDRLLSVAHFNRADNAVLEYFLNHFAHKPDAEDRVFLLVTHDGPLIREFQKLHDGVEMRKDLLGELQQVALGNGEYRRFGVDRSVLERMPFGEAITARGFVDFLEQQMERAKPYDNTAQSHEAMAELKAAIKELKKSSAHDVKTHPETAHLSNAQHAGSVIQGMETERSPGASAAR